MKYSKKFAFKSKSIELVCNPRFMNTKPAVAEHLKIIEAVENRDGDAAAAAMSEHLEKSHRRAIGLD